MRPTDIERSDLEYAPLKASDICPAGGSKSVVIIFPESLECRGGKLVTDGKAAYGDWIEIQAIDIYEYIPPGPAPYGRDAWPNWPILKNWIPDYGVDWKNCADVILLPYMGTVYQGFALKATYHSVGPDPVGFTLNTDTHRKL